MKFNPRDEPVAPIFEYSVDAFGNELVNFFTGKETPVFLLKQQGDMDDIKKQNPNVKPPFFTYRPGDVSLFDEGLNNERLQRHGTHFGGPRDSVDEKGRPLDPNKNYTRLNAVSVELNISVEYVCSYSEQIHFSQIWVPLAVRPVKFEIDYKGMIVPCLMMFDKSITFSDVDFDNDSLVECQTNCVLRTWMATEGKTRPVSRYTAPFKVVGEKTGDPEGHRVYTETQITIDDEGKVEVES